MRRDQQGRLHDEPFMFGVATSDHQAEAYDNVDDIWDIWERTTGRVPRGKATDFWNRYAEDIESAKRLGCKMFRPGSNS